MSKSIVFTNLDFIFIQSGLGCSSNCLGCERKNVDSKILDENKILLNINTLIDKRLFSNNLLIYNTDYFDFNSVFITKILLKRRYFSQIYFHTNFRKISDSSFVSQEILFLYQRDLDKSEVTFLKSLIGPLFFPQNKKFFILWYDDISFVIILLNHFVRAFPELKVKKQGSNFFLKGNNIDIKIRYKKGRRKELNFCILNNAILPDKDNQEILFDSTIFSKLCFEILINGDIRIHDPPCGFGNIVVSSINHSVGEIIQNFSSFADYMYQFNIKYKNFSQKEICNNCNMQSYHF